MREIKYRAWHKKYKYMARVADISFNRGIVNLNAADISKIEDIELMQYTGLKDRNGVKIFEGDIVKLWKEKSDDYDSWFEPTRELKVINFKNGCFRFGCREFSSYNMCSYELEVIGNIYENKELLEGVEK